MQTAMKTSDAKYLNDRFGIGDCVVFRSGPSGLPVAHIANPHATAAIAVQGGHVTEFQPRNEAPVLWVSAQSRFERGKAIRGGIPVCWPWFGAHPTDPDKPAHGFARTSLWTVRATSILAGDVTQVRLGLADDNETRDLWPHAFDLQITIEVGIVLRVNLLTRNTGREGFAITDALHSYFRVGDVTGVSIRGLAGRAYLDEVDGMKRKVQDGPVTIGGEVDRIYLDTEDDCLIDDPKLNRTIRVTKRGSRSTVVWNPWAAKAARMKDFGDREYSEMVCVETANAAGDAVTVPPGGEHCLGAVIRAERR